MSEAAPAGNDPLLGRIGIQHQVHLGAGLRVITEGVVQQMVEYLAI